MRKVLENVLCFALAIVSATEIEKYYFHEVDGLKWMLGFTIIAFGIYGLLINAFWEIDKHEKRKRLRKIKELKNRDLKSYEKERGKIYENIEN